MRVLHVSDWHLGATLGRIRREPDLVRVLDEIAAIAQSYEPHLVIHTGDLFDSVRPPVESMRLAFATLRRLSRLAPVLVVAGNHDSRPLFRLFNQILALTRDEEAIRFVADVVRPEDGGILEYPGDDGEVARVACLPFLHPNALVDVFETAPKGWTGKYADGVRLLQEMYKRSFESDYDPARHINLYAAHLHVGGAVLARSERIVHVSEDYAVDSESLPPVSYAAFGHIHKPQRLPGLVPGRYAGSPIQLDYGEMGEQKSVVTADLRPGKSARIETVDVIGGRPLLRFDGTWSELEDKARYHTEPSILTATVVTDEPEKDPSARIADLFPNADILNVFNRVTSQKDRVVPASASGESEASFRDGFAEYLVARDGLGKATTSRVVSLFNRLLNAVESEEQPVLAEERQLAVVETG
jgi:exonuclease SbcD